MILSGQVQLPSLKVSAQRAAMNIEDVRGVINQLELLPAFDDDIPSEPSLQIYSHSQPSHAIPPTHIIIVKNGKLTRKGVVTCDSDKTIVGIHANQVPNVHDVVNNLHAENRTVQ